jgi:hypothetical protein
MTEDEEFGALLAKISAERGFRCQSYKEKCLRRRIGVRLRARGVQGYAAYSQLLDGDTREYEKLLDTLTINVTKLFRNWETYERLASHVVPAVWEGHSAAVNVWSAGSSSGEEAYSLGVLMHRHAKSVGELGRLSRVRILGTDIDRASLAQAERGTFTEASFGDTRVLLRPHAAIRRRSGRRGVGAIRTARPDQRAGAQRPASDRLPQRIDLLRPRYARAVVPSVSRRVGSWRVSGARESGDPPRSDAATVRSGGCARAHLSTPVSE